ncbi:hypothetical protein D3C72_2464280 [compost metagenome]
MAQKIAKGGASAFSFNGNGFGFSTGFGGGGFRQPPPFTNEERDVTHSPQAIDVTPIKVTHEPKRHDDQGNQ